MGGRGTGGCHNGGESNQICRIKGITAIPLDQSLPRGQTGTLGRIGWEYFSEKPKHLYGESAEKDTENAGGTAV